MDTLVGIDEVGRGCWAGPLLVVAARATAPLPVGLADSKLLSRRKREAFTRIIVQNCDLGEGWVSPKEIDKLGLTAAMKLAVKRALRAIEAKATDLIIMDGNYNYCPDNFMNVSCVIRADATIPIVSAASIYAKVMRDAYMAKQAIKYPVYLFESNVGYGTAAHIAALKQWGICDLHRLSYTPVKALLL